MLTFHVNFNRDPTDALKAPVTEISIATLTGPIYLETIRSAASSFIAKLGSVEAKGKIASAWGQASEDENTFVLLVGWETADDDWEARHTASEVQKVAFVSLRKIANVHGRHAKLVEYS